MKKIFQYLNYREFLKERFLFLKKTKRNVTHRSLSKKAGFASPNFLKLVMDGDRNLTQDSLPKVCVAFDLSDKECAFFQSLVHFNQAKDLKTQEEHYQNLKRIRQDLSTHRLEHAQMEYLESWHRVALREMTQWPDFQEDPLWIQSRLGKEVSLPEIKRSLELLEKLGFLKRDEKGKLCAQQKAISTGDEVAHLAAYRFHEGMIQKGKEALQKCKAEERDISSLTLAISQEKFLEVKKRIQQFRKEILCLLQDETGEKSADAVYQMNIQFFNLTESLWDSKK